ncbi:MAG: alanine--tRNA ligase [Candidatus Handelsmanbacteria bacterium RIFCSPLOWO2_12_FULL_64_10]|uniref:Alanine--tRNA ligase n=1 Tax=Handelsmanbacteria sp. (strain RIFCSPLOWO2_12_FULL_64_10) TaxID=1817868 RepID=A0A1F6CL02_HANXR|nr:MAG: alanine--tRNA ligase [Candidatus Handelsmanbacteria bacterium RIFCSPLOWO2_12_FULL_64_10]
MTSKLIREQFLRFFEERGHRRVRSASVVPLDDPTLLFTNAGMNQFKDVFLGTGRRDYTRAVDTQKCIRVSGKHNDLEEVGRSPNHQTLFEMLGNWSFGDYYKREAIRWAWELLTEVWRLPKERLWATVYLDDDEAEGLWYEETDLIRGRVLRFEKENFWEMGETGPCGPNSEIHYYRGDRLESQRAEGVNSDDTDYTEIWNLVFIQYNRDEAGALSVLPAKHVDTGMGFERICSVLQGVRSNYDTDIFRPIISAVCDTTGRPYDNEHGVAIRVIADHLRMLAFGIADGVMPSNEGRGYVLRRVLRRAARYGRTLGLHEPFIHKLTPTLVGEMGEAYPELVEKAPHIALVIRSEEEGFGRTLDRGIDVFEKISASGDINGADAFRLYDTYGFPLDLTQLMASEKGLSVDVEGFQQEMERQRARSREATKALFTGGVRGSMDAVSGDHSRFVGYEETLAEATVVRCDAGEEGRVDLVLSVTPFYAESGGQIGDTGRIRGKDFEIAVEDTIRVDGAILHRGRQIAGDLRAVPAARVTAQIDAERRIATARNHTATHLFHAALRSVLGDHVHQAGSLVAPDRLRFDFTHFTASEQEQIERIEEIVNERVREDLPVSTSLMGLDEARALGAMALFGEKYGDVVRVVKIGDYSLELCGGTHLSATGQIGTFRLLSEGGVAAGVRRAEAATGAVAQQVARSERVLLSDLGRLLKVPPSSELLTSVERLLLHNRDLEREVEALRRQTTGSEIESMVSRAQTVNGFRVVAARVSPKDLDDFRRMADSLREKIGSGVGVLGAALDDRATFLTVVTDDLIQGKGLRAGDIVKEVAKIVGGKGGGKPHLAQAGGNNVSQLENALASAVEIVKKQVKG